jgi:hypothetical protein
MLNGMISRFFVRLLGAAGILLFLPGCVLVSGHQDELRHPDEPLRVVTPGEVAREGISVSSMAQCLEFLRSDRARPTGSRESLQRQAAWVATQYELAGLDPAGDSGGYVQYWVLGERGDTSRAPTVVGLLPGSEPALDGEYIVLLASMGDVAGDTLRDDDRSARGGGGVAVLTEVARALGADPHRPSRPVLFVVVTGFDGGPGGAEWFVRNPTVPLAEAAAVIFVGSARGAGPAALSGPAAAAGPASSAGSTALVSPTALAGPSASEVPVASTGRGGRTAAAVADVVEVVADGRSSLDRFVEQVARENPDLELRVVRSDVGGSGGGDALSGWAAPEAFGAVGLPYVIVDPRAGVRGGTGGRSIEHNGRTGRNGRAGLEADADLLTRVARLVFLGVHGLASAESRSVWAR